jgi:hypothetical protein
VGVQVPLSAPNNRLRVDKIRGAILALCLQVAQIDCGYMSSIATKEAPSDAETRVPILRRIFQVLLDWFATSRNPARLRSIFLVLLVVVCGVTAFIGAVPTLIYGHDDFLLLENGWRVLFGQRPQLDFWSPWGPVMFLAMALGLKVGNTSPNGIGYANAIFGLLAGLWAYRLGRNRLTPIVRVLLPLYATLLICAPYPLGESPLLSSHAMLYNRYGYALIVLMIVECFQPVRDPKRELEDRLGGISTGAAAALAFFLKVSFFLVSLPLIGASLILWRPSRKRILAILLGFGSIALLNMAYLKFNFPAVVNALRAAAGARAQAWSPLLPIRIVEANPGPFFLVMVIALAGSFLFRGRRTWREEYQLPLVAALLYLVEIGLISTNGQGPDWPILPVFSLLVASRTADNRNESPAVILDSQLPYHSTLILLCGLLFLPQFIAETAGLAAGAIRKAHPSPVESPVRFTEPRLSSLLLYNSPSAVKSSSGSVYTTYVNDGAALLRRNCDSRDRVLTMDMQNPFPFSLGWQPPRGGIASTAFNFTLSAKYRPSFDAYFGDATVVMVPKRPAATPHYLEGFYAIYLPAMLERFQLADQSDWFDLYKRK